MTHNGKFIRYDPIEYFDQGGSGLGEMTEDVNGDYLLANDVENLILLIIQSDVNNQDPDALRENLYSAIKAIKE